MYKVITRSPLFYTFSKLYKVPYNINKQQHNTYLKKVERAQQQIITNQTQPLIPRRKRRIYDRPRIDNNLQGYGAWRVFQRQEMIVKTNQHAMEVFKINLQPKWLVHAFGIGGISQANPRSADKQFYFQDNRLNTFLLYQYRNTVSFKPNKQGYDYQNQQHLHPRVRIVKRLEPEQFWKSQEKFQFRINYTIYAQKFKFQQWLLREIQKKKSQKSYDQYIDSKYGKVFTFNVKQDCNRFQPNVPMVTMVTPQSFNVSTTTGANVTQGKKKGKKAEKAQKADKIEQPKVRLGKKLDESFRIKERLTPQTTSETKKQQVAK